MNPTKVTVHNHVHVGNWRKCVVNANGESYQLCVSFVLLMNSILSDLSNNRITDARFLMDIYT